MNNEPNISKKKNNKNEYEDVKLEDVVKELNDQKEEEKRIEQEKIEKLNQEHMIEAAQLEENVSNNVTKLFFILIIFGCLLFGFMKFYDYKNKTPEVLDQDEKILKVLKTRYGKDFKKVNKETYEDDNGISFYIKTNNNAGSRFILFDTYLNVLLVNPIEKEFEGYLSDVGLNGVQVKLSPEKDCRFVGSCASSDEYLDNYEDNTNEIKLAERSNEINLSSYLGMSKLNFYNSMKFKININSVGNYEEGDQSMLRKAISDFFDIVNDKGYKNYLGYRIDIKEAEGIESILKIEGSKTKDLEYHIEN